MFPWGTDGGRRETVEPAFRPCRVLFSIFLFLSTCLGAEDGEPKRREFADGVLIDWSQRTVEAEGAVVLRQGELELFACSARTREHESIVVMRGRPLHIFQALGLIGLTPGEPVRYHAESRRWDPPTGDAIEWRVRYESDGVQYTVPPEHWLVELREKRPPEKLHWVFAGSRKSSDGKFGADIEGTVVTVVDFETAIVAVGSLHSAENAQLWLGARTEAIPPVGTRVTLLFRATSPKDQDLIISIGTDGKPRLGDSEIDLAELSRRAAENAAARVVIKQAEQAKPTQLIETVEGLVGRGVAKERIEVRPPDPPMPRADERNPGPP